MDKVQILTTCHVCHGASFLPTNEVMHSANGRNYVRHVPCTACAGSGRESRWIEIRDFADRLFDSQREEEETQNA
jgi:DnaJ-class molecular chaperone